MAREFKDRYGSDFVVNAKAYLKEYVESITPSDPSGTRNAYICPCCKSGEGENHTGAFNIFKDRKTGELKFHCFACDIAGDIFDLAGYVNNTSSFAEKKKIVADFLHVDLNDPTRTRPVAKPVDIYQRTFNPEEQAALRGQAREYVAKCEKNIGATDYFKGRGFNDDTIARFHLGFDDSFRIQLKDKNGNINPNCPATYSGDNPPKEARWSTPVKMAIIPFTKSYYISRNTAVEEGGNGFLKHYKPAGLIPPLFNLGAMGTIVNPNRDPVFVCEAPLDAMSIEQAGGHAVAVAGTAWRELVRICNIYQPKNTFILAFDNDDRGQEAENRLALKMDEIGKPYIHLAGQGSFGQFKDANKALIEDPAWLARSVQQAVDRALVVPNRERDAANYEDKAKKDMGIAGMAGVAHDAATLPSPQQGQGKRSTERERA